MNFAANKPHFFSCSQVRLWSALTGRLQKSFADLASDDITALCADDRCTRLFVGDRRGALGIYHFATGALLRRLSSHRGAIEFVDYSPTERVILRCRVGGPRIF